MHLSIESDCYGARGRVMKKVTGALALLACSWMSLAVYAAPPSPPVDLCVQSPGAVTQCAENPVGEAGVFPGTNLKFHPGIAIYRGEDESPASLEAMWQELFTSSRNRKSSYRPDGIYGGVVAILRWHRFYDNHNIRPRNPEDPNDPAYDWSIIDDIFAINAVRNEGAMVAINIRDATHGLAIPNWLAAAPYDGTMSTRGPANDPSRRAPRYYRYTGPDSLGRTNVGVRPPIVEEYVMFHEALRRHLVATGNIDKVMYVSLAEIFTGGTDNKPPDFNSTTWYHGQGVRLRKVAEVWARSRIMTMGYSAVSGSSSASRIRWNYMQAPSVGIGFPDHFMHGTNNFSTPNRFNDPITGENQKDKRLLVHASDRRGILANTHFSAGIPNPWGYSNRTVPQTISHVVWSLSGSPRGENKDSGLGQQGVDPAGIFPVHIIEASWGRSWGDETEPSVEDWHRAIDTFGPPGTFAFPYLPAGYRP